MQHRDLSVLLLAGCIALLVSSTNAARVVSSKQQYDYDLTPPGDIIPPAPGSLQNQQRFMEMRAEPATPTPITSSVPADNNSTTNTTTATTNTTVATNNATAPAVTAVVPQISSKKRQPVMTYVVTVRQRFTDESRALGRERELYEALLKSLGDQSVMLKKQQFGFHNDSATFSQVLKKGGELLEQLAPVFDGIPEIRKRLRTTYRALGRNIDGTVPPNSNTTKPSFLEVESASAMQILEASTASVRAKLTVGARNILERVRDALEELFSQAENRNKALQFGVKQARRSALKAFKGIPGLLAELETRNRLNEKFALLMQAEKNNQVTKFRQLMPYFIELSTQVRNLAHLRAEPAPVGTTLDNTPNATNPIPASSNLTSLTAPIKSPEPKDPVNPAVYWNDLMEYLRDINDTAAKNVVEAMDMHSKLFKSHNLLLQHYKKLIEDFHFIMNEARAQMSIMASTIKSLPHVIRRFKEISADPNVPPNVKDDFQEAQSHALDIRDHFEPTFKLFFEMRNNLLDLHRPMGQGYITYRRVVLASRNLFAAELNQIIEGWRNVGAACGILIGQLQHHIKYLSNYKLKLK